MQFHQQNQSWSCSKGDGSSSLDLNTEGTWGVSYRALGDIIQAVKAREEVIEYEVSVQMIEIYNEQVRDLLILNGSTRRLNICNNALGPNVPHASWVPVTSTQDV